MEHILIIDDDVDMCLLLHRFLSRNGYEVSYAHTGKKGLELMDLQTPDIILCDFRLQDTDGKKVREITLSYTFHEIPLPQTQAALAGAPAKPVNWAHIS